MLYFVYTRRIILYVKNICLKRTREKPGLNFQTQRFRLLIITTEIKIITMPTHCQSVTFSSNKR